ncbi:MAG: hypothetical protein AAFV07_09500 [Bacteroidota bacterium]
MRKVISILLMLCAGQAVGQVNWHGYSGIDILQPVLERSSGSSPDFPGYEIQPMVRQQMGIELEYPVSNWFALGGGVGYRVLGFQEAFISGFQAARSLHYGQGELSLKFSPAAGPDWLQAVSGSVGAGVLGLMSRPRQSFYHLSRTQRDTPWVPMITGGLRYRIMERWGIALSYNRALTPIYQQFSEDASQSFSVNQYFISLRLSYQLNSPAP